MRQVTIVICIYYHCKKQNPWTSDDVIGVGISSMKIVFMIGLIVDEHKHTQQNQ